MSGWRSISAAAITGNETRNDFTRLQQLAETSARIKKWQSFFVKSGLTIGLGAQALLCRFQDAVHQLYIGVLDHVRLLDLLER